MNLTKRMLATALLAMTLSVPSQVMANTQNDVAVQICAIATSGIKTAATERQAGKSKSATKAVLDRDLQNLSRRISNQAFIRQVTDTWYRGLDKVYQDPVLSTSEEKAVYISTLTADAIVSCLESLS